MSSPDTISAKKFKQFQDLALATFLIISGNPLVKSPAPRSTALIRSDSDRKLVFTFEETKKLEEDVLAFYNKTARVDPLSFSEMFRNLKSLTF